MCPARPSPDDPYELLARLAHEVRTPLASILLLAELLAEQGGQAARQARKIHTATSGVLDLLNATSDLVKLESGRSRPQVGEVKLERFLEEVAGRHTAPARDEPSGLQVRTDPDLPPTVRLDEQRVGAILELVLARFSQQHRAALSLEARAAGSTLELVVHGAGDGATADGSGLRHELAARLARTVGGELELSGEDRGAKIHLRLPLEEGHRAR